MPCSKVDGKISIKKDFCIYCKKVTKMPHLQKLHKTEKKVEEFIQLPRGLYRRRVLINQIRKEGNFLHNRDPKYNT